MSWTAPWVTVEVGYGSTWQTEPGDITWTDETAKVLVDHRVRCQRGASSARGKVDVGTAEFSLKNGDRRFDPTHATGDLFGQLLPGTPVRLLAWPVDQLLMVAGQIVLVDGLPVTTGSSIELWSGTVPSWPQRYNKSNRHAWCPISAWDRFDKLSRAKIPRSVLESEILADAPVAYWRLDETTGKEMGDQSGNAWDGSYIHGTTALSEEREAEDGGRARGLVLDGEHVGLVRSIERISARPCTFVALVQPSPNVTNAYSMVVQGGTGDTRGMFALGVKDLGESIGWRAAGAMWDDDPNHDDTLSTTVSYSDSFHCIAYRGISGATAQIYVDGEDATLSTLKTSNAIPSSPGVTVGAFKWTTTGPGLTYKGWMSNVALFDKDVGAARIAAYSSAGLSPLSGQTSDERIDWILDEIGWPAGFRDLAVGRSLLGPATFKPGDGALQYLRLVEDTEDGLLFVGPDGSLVFHDRFWPYLETAATVSQFTFTDQDGDQGYAEFQLDLDDELLVNVARFSRRDGAEQVATDTASIASYGEAEEVRSNLLSTTDAQVRSLAEWAVATKSTPLPRVPKIRIPLHRYSAADQATVLGLDLGHRVTVNRTPQGVGAEIDLDFIVDGVSHDIGFNEWWVDLFVSPVPEDSAELFILGTSELGGTHILAH